MATPKELFWTAVVNNSPPVIVASNRPLEDPTPSRDDIHASKRLVEAGEIMDIEVLDHSGDI